MNEKLKQSLQGRLDGMRWGEREQAEVFRQIRKKEMQDVKQIKRTSGLLAMAIVLLFLVMGSAYAVSQLPQPEDRTLLSRNPQPTFLPAAAAQFENEYITLTIDKAVWDGANASFEATIRLKEPDQYALSIDGYSNPGGEGREVLDVSLSANSVISTEPVYHTYSCFNLPELLNMTEDSATIRMSGNMQLEGRESIEFSLWLAAEGSQTSFIAEVPFTFRQSNPEAAAVHRRLLFSNSHLNCYLIAARHADTSGIFTVELEPAKPWYAINTEEPGKSNLLVSVSDVIASEAASMQVLTTAPMNIAAQDGIARASAILSFPEAQNYVTLRCEITATDPVTGSTVTQPVTLNVSSLEIQQAAATTPTPAPAEAVSTPLPTMPALSPSPTPTPPPFAAASTPLLENEYIIATLAECTPNRIVIDVVPASEEYSLNRSVEGKNQLGISLGDFQIFYGASREEVMKQVELRQLSASRWTIITTEVREEGLRFTAVGLMPEGKGPFFAYADATIHGFFLPGFPVGGLHTELLVPIPAEAPLPTVTSTPTPLPTPTGKVLGGSDIVTVWLEESWYDGFSAEAMLRIRADDPAHRLALLPNEGGAPSDSTWVVQVESSLHDSYWSPLTSTLTRDETTGDVLLHLTYENLTDSQRRMTSGQLYPLNLPLTITATSERSWERSVAEVTVSLETPEIEDIQPLYLVESTGEDVFVQGAMYTSDRYRYIGIMLGHGSYGIPAAHLLDKNGTTHVTDGYFGVDGNSLLVFPLALFPYEGDRDAQFCLLVLKLDKDVPLPETLPVTIMQQRNDSVSRLAVLQLSTEPRDMPERTLIDGQYASVVLTNVSNGEGWTTGRLRIDLKDPRAYSLVNYGPDHPAEHLDVDVKLTAMSVVEDGSLRSMGSFKLLSTDGLHSNRQEYFFTGGFEEWAALKERTVLAEVTVMNDKGNALETLAVMLPLPQRGGVTAYRLVRTEDAPMENLEYHGGTLLVSPDACFAEMTYRCTGNCTQANFIPYTDGERLDYRLRYIDAYPELKEPIKITRLWWEPDGPVPETIDFIVEDANHSPHPEIARFTVRVEPVDP